MERVVFYGLLFLACAVGGGCAGVSRATGPSSARQGAEAPQQQMVLYLYGKAASAKALPVYLDEGEKRRLHATLGKRERKSLTQRFFKSDEMPRLAYALAPLLDEDEFAAHRVALSWSRPVRFMAGPGGQRIPVSIHVAVFSPHRGGNNGLMFLPDGTVLASTYSRDEPPSWFVGENLVSPLPR